MGTRSYKPSPHSPDVRRYVSLLSYIDINYTHLNEDTDHVHFLQ